MRRRERQARQSPYWGGKSGSGAGEGRGGSPQHPPVLLAVPRRPPPPHAPPRRQRRRRQHRRRQRRQRTLSRGRGRGARGGRPGRVGRRPQGGRGGVSALAWWWGRAWGRRLCYCGGAPAMSSALCARRSPCALSTCASSKTSTPSPPTEPPADPALEEAALPLHWPAAAAVAASICCANARARRTCRHRSGGRDHVHSPAVATRVCPPSPPAAAGPKGTGARLSEAGPGLACGGLSG